MFYPVDPASITLSTPEAVYPLDPINGFWPTTLSSDWELYGNDRAYEGPASSARRPFPLVLFSPGLGAPIWAHNFLAGRLASHGFVVALMYHFGDGFRGWEPPDDMATAAANRPLDMSFVLDRLLEKNAAPGDLLAGLIDPGLIAASGWSYGGYAATALAAGVDNIGLNLAEQGYDVPPETHVPIPADPRIKAIVLLDGSSWVMRFQELTRVSVPAMGLGEEWSTLEEIYGDPFTSWQARQHAAFQGQPNYRVDVAGAWHQSFSNLCEGLTLVFDKGIANPPGRVPICSVPLPSRVANRLVAKFVVAFLKTNLSRDQGYQSLMTPGHVLKDEPRLEFFVTEKRNPNAIDEDWPESFVYFPHQSGSQQARAEKNSHVALPIGRLVTEE